ncbi:hypothetical protein BZA70DRAFT_309491, partial [Myxozyma melibiosi]
MPRATRSTTATTAAIKNEHQQQENQPPRKRARQQAPPAAFVEEYARKQARKDLTAFSFKPHKQMDFFSTVSASPSKAGAQLDKMKNERRLFEGLDEDEGGEGSELEKQVERVKLIFAALDTVLFMVYSGDVVGVQTSFLQVKADVERSCRRNFSLLELRQILGLYKDAYAVTKKSTGLDYILNFPSTITKRELTAPDFLRSRNRTFISLCAAFLQSAEKDKTIVAVPAAKLPESASPSSVVRQRQQVLKKDASQVQLLLRGESKFIPLPPPSTPGTTGPTLIKDRQSSLLARIKAKQADRATALSQRRLLTPAEQRRFNLLGKSCAPNSAIDVILHLASQSTAKPTHLPLRKLVEMIRDSVRVSGASVAGRGGVLSVEEATEMVEAVA